MFMTHILVLQGPNLNLLGTREPDTYGHTRLCDLEQQLQQHVSEHPRGHDVTLHQYQSNAEHELIDRIHQAKQEGVSFIIINPAAFTHTSVALRDALAGVDIPFIELHISNVHQREAFRHRSYLSDIAVGVICGLGVQGYTLALDYALNQKETAL